jgi:hypothetical protein
LFYIGAVGFRRAAARDRLPDFRLLEATGCLALEPVTRE